MVAAGSGNYEYRRGYGMNAGGLSGEDGITLFEYNYSSLANPYVASGANQTHSGTYTHARNVVGRFGIAGYLNSTGEWGVLQWIF